MAAPERAAVPIAFGLGEGFVPPESSFYGGSKFMDKVLMIEDESSLRDWFEAMLGALGRQVEWLSSADLAQEMLSDPGQRWDLVVSDFDLHSRLTGLDLWQLCQKKQPQTPFLLISGVPDYLFHSMIRSGAPCPEFLLKPFGAKEFQKTLEGLLIRKADPEARLAG